MGSLDKSVSGFFSEGINEIIATTNYNAAPMGIIRKHDSLSMIIFKSSHTAANIIRDGWVVAHITHDPLLFVQSAFEDLSLDYFTEEKIGPLTCHRLRDSTNWIAFTADVTNQTGEKIFVRLTPVHAEVAQGFPTPVNRGFNNLIEATVHGTRYILDTDPHLADLIRHHGSLVMRCGGESDKKALSLLYSYLNQVSPHTFR